MKKKIKWHLVFLGAVGGFLNGLFGAGGGTVVVPMLKKEGYSQKESHATSVAIILPITIVSASFYLFRDPVPFKDIYPFIIGGIIGAPFGAFLLKKIDVKWLKRIFGVLILIMAVRMVLK